jgi:TRAP-type C4-dicarboxylate transport system permease small subunit
MREDVVRKLSWGIDSVVMWVLALFMAAETVIVFSAVVSRYVFNYSFAWSDEVARGLLTWLIFLGSTAAYRRGELIDIPFFKEQMSPALTRLVLILGGIATAIFLAYTVRYGWMLTGRTARQVTAVLGIKLYWFSGAVIVGSAVMLIHVVSDLPASASSQDSQDSQLI